jgi:hypothetical protein
LFNYSTKNNYSCINRIEITDIPKSKENRYTGLVQMSQITGGHKFQNKVLLRMNLMIFVYKLDCGLLPSYFDRCRVRGMDVHKYNTRNKENLIIGKMNRMKCRRGVLHRGVLLYN